MKRPCPIGKEEKTCGIATDCLSCDYYYGLQVKNKPDSNIKNLIEKLDSLKKDTDSKVVRDLQQQLCDAYTKIMLLEKEIAVLKFKSL